MADYDIGEAFRRIEEIMIASMKRNLTHHLDLEHEENINYTQWQAEQIAAMRDFQSRNKSLFNGYFSTIDSQIEEVLNRAYSSGEMEQEIKILEAIKKGWKQRPASGSTVGGEFFHLNDDKLGSLVNATKQDMHKAETAMLRMTDDQYRKTIFNSMVYHQSGAGNLKQCIDMATKDFLSKGINCIQYSDGRRVSIEHYAEMALRTAHTRAYLQGEAKKRDEWGVNTVIVNKRSAGCPKCMRYAGKVFYDDVWSSLPVKDNKYPRLSSAMQGGLYHPNCKDIHTTYFEDISTPPEQPTAQEQSEAEEVYQAEQRQNYNERQINKFKRLRQGSVDPENIEKYTEKLKEWQRVQKEFKEKYKEILSREPEKEKLMSLPEPGEITLEKSTEYDIIQIGSIQSKINKGQVVNPMQIERYKAMRKGLERIGYSVVAATGDDYRFLLAFGAEAIADHMGIIHLGDVPSASAFFEEVIHLAQIRMYGIVASDDLIERAAREIAANRKLLKFGKSYGFTNDDFEEIRANLNYWEIDFERRAGVSYDESGIDRKV